MIAKRHNDCKETRLWQNDTTMAKLHNDDKETQQRKIYTREKSTKLRKKTT